MSTTKADLEGAKKVAEVDLSEWIDGDGGKGYVCAIRANLLLTLGESTDGEAEGLASERAATYAWVIHCFCDSRGKLIFDDSEAALVFLGDRPFKMLQAICEAAMTLNGVGEKGQAETAKN